MLDDIKLLLKYNCPYSNCDVSCEGWPELKRHIKDYHHLMLWYVNLYYNKVINCIVLILIININIFEIL